MTLTNQIVSQHYYAMTILMKRWNSHYAGDLEEMAGLTTTKSETLFLSLTIDIYLGILILYILY